MALHEFECSLCGERFERVMHYSEVHDPDCPLCGGKTDQVYDRGNGASFFRMTPGKETGVYDFDYGKKATWDLTVPGKMERLKKEGTIADPFDK
jgi:putative FmdB family regulatory protein